MKKTLFVLIMMLCCIGVNAQRVAVLDFNAGVGVSQADVDGISAIFNTYFSPIGYTLVERTQINKAIDEQNFQRGSFTESQMVKIGQILNVSNVVVGDINIVAGQYNVDVRVINVQSGTIQAAEGATWTSGTSYRNMMKGIAEKLANKIAINPVAPSAPGGGGNSSSTSRKRTSVETIYGYLRVFPEELGSFESVPNTVINQLNSQAIYGYNTWRIPTNEELSLMKANGYLSGGTYMTKENTRGIVLLVTDKADAVTLKAEAEAKELEKQRQEYEKKLSAAKNDLNAIINGTTSWSFDKQYSRVDEISKSGFQDVGINDLVTKAIATINSRKQALEGILYDHEWVDLGLSVKWATCNVGASKPEDYGNYYAWGETTTKSSYTESNSKTYGKSMGDIKGNSSYDAATANWGGNWRMPTKTEMQELIDKCTWEWTTQNGVKGYKVTGPNGNSIFLPAAGTRIGSSLYDAGGFGSCWSSAPSEYHDYDAYYLYFDRGGNHSMDSSYGRYHGRSVRSVLE